MRLSLRSVVRFCGAVLSTGMICIVVHLLNVFWWNPWFFYPDCYTGSPAPSKVEGPEVTIGMTLHRSNPAYQLTYEQSVETWLPYLGSDSKAQFLLLDSVSKPPLRLAPQFTSKLAPIQRQDEQPPFHSDREGYSFFYSTYGLLQRTNTTHFCNFNNDILVDRKYREFSHLWRRTLYFQTNEQYYTPNICAETRRWRAAICSFPTALVRGRVLRTTSMDQLLILLLKAERAPHAETHLVHIPHQGSAYADPYSYVTIRQWRILLYLIRFSDSIQREIDPDVAPRTLTELLTAHVQSGFWRFWLEVAFCIIGSWPVYPVLDTLTSMPWMWAPDLWMLNHLGIKALVWFSVIKWFALFYWTPALLSRAYMRYKDSRQNQHLYKGVPI